MKILSILLGIALLLAVVSCDTEQAISNIESDAIKQNCIETGYTAALISEDGYYCYNAEPDDVFIWHNR